MAMYRVKRFSISEDRFFNDDYYEDGRKSNSSGSNWVMPTLAGAGLAAGGFYGARKGMFGESLQKTANNAWGSLGNMVGSQSMIDSAANDYTKGLEGDAATKAKNEFLDKHKIVEEQPAQAPAPQNNQTQSQATESKPAQPKQDSSLAPQNNQGQKTTKRGDGSSYRRYRQGMRGQSPAPAPKPQNTGGKGGSILGGIFSGIKNAGKRVGSGITSGFAYLGRGAKRIKNTFNNSTGVNDTYRILTNKHAGLQQSVAVVNDKVGSKFTSGKGYMPSVMARKNEIKKKVYGPEITKKDRAQMVVDYNRKQQKKLEGRERAREIAIQRAKAKGGNVSTTTSKVQSPSTIELTPQMIHDSYAKSPQGQKAAIEKRGHLVENFDVSKYRVKPGTTANYANQGGVRSVSDPRAEYAARMAKKQAGAELYGTQYKNVTKRVRPKTSFQTAVKRRTFHSDFGIVSYRIPRFSQKLFADSEKKDSGSTLGKIVTGTALAAGTFYGARKGMLGNTLRRGSNTLYGQVGKMVGSESMVNSAAANYAKGAVKNPGAFTRMTNSSARDAYQNDLAKSATEFKTNLMTPKQPANPAPAPASGGSTSPAGGGSTTTSTTSTKPVSDQNTSPAVGGQYGF
jgi:hypothetical protein